MEFSENELLTMYRNQQQINRRHVTASVEQGTVDYTCKPEGTGKKCLQNFLHVNILRSSTRKIEVTVWAYY
jgi:hypothetical protein